MARPRSERAHADVLDAAARLFAERGIDQTSMDAIAAEAGVSKATIYKHWPDKSRLCLDVVSHVFASVVGPPAPTGDVRADIVALLDYQPSTARPDLKGRVMPHLMAYAARDPSFATAWRALAFDPPRTALADLLRRAVREGVLVDDLDPDFTALTLIGPMIYRNVLRTLGGEPPAALARRVVDELWRARGRR